MIVWDHSGFPDCEAVVLQRMTILVYSNWLRLVWFWGSPGMSMFFTLSFYPGRAIWMQSFAWDPQESRSPAGAGCWEYKTNSHCTLSQACHAVTVWVHNSQSVCTYSALAASAVLWMYPHYWALPESYCFSFLPPQILTFIFTLPPVGLARRLPDRLHGCLRSKLRPGAWSQNWILSPTVAS